MDYTKYSKAELLTLCQVYKAKITYLEGTNKKESEQVCTLHSACQYQSGFNECSYFLQCDYKKKTCG
jgi:hypothetical protein